MNMSYGARQARRKRGACGMILPEMLCFIALIVCIVIGVKYGHQITGSWYGYLLGGILGIIAFLVCVFGLGFLMHLWSKRRK